MGLCFDSTFQHGTDADTLTTFTVAQYPHQLVSTPPDPFPPGSDLASWTVPCMRHLYLCPNMGRFFGDQGSYLVCFNPLQITRAKLRSKHLSPYGCTAIWRLHTGEKPCARNCSHNDPILPPAYITLPSCMPTDCICYHGTSLCV